MCEDAVLQTRMTSQLSSAKCGLTGRRVDHIGKCQNDFLLVACCLQVDESLSVVD